MRIGTLKHQSISVVDGFSKQARSMRREFERRFGSPLDASEKVGGRFLWDFWHVPGKFRLLRTRPEAVFSQKTLTQWVNRLALWGRQELGCHGLTPVWLSSYVDGCEQRWHKDLPHGTWAFVFSLSPSIRGGKTEIKRGSRVTRVEPAFNRLVVFDPALTHRVSVVRGAKDVLDGRLVLHGWFVHARPYVDGALPASFVQNAIDGWMEHLQSECSFLKNTKGAVVLRLRVRPSGKTESLDWLSSTMKEWNQGQQKQFMSLSETYWQSVQWPKRKRSSWITVPLQC